MDAGQAPIIPHVDCVPDVTMTLGNHVEDVAIDLDGTTLCVEVQAQGWGYLEVRTPDESGTESNFELALYGENDVLVEAGHDSSFQNVSYAIVTMDIEIAGTYRVNLVAKARNHPARASLLFSLYYPLGP
jgi:hypothetical protein